MFCKIFFDLWNKLFNPAVIVNLDQNLSIVRRLAVVIVGQDEAQGAFTDEFCG